MNVLSLFDGISCGRLVLQRAGIPVERYVAFEIDKYAISVSKYNFPGIEHRGDVKGVNFKEFKGFDMVIGGFPCTDLSICKNNREGLKGSSSSLFWELVRAIKEVEPRYFLAENNYGMPPADFNIICDTLGCKPVLINSALVSAQNRRRYYWTNINTIKVGLFDYVESGIMQPIDKGLVLTDIIENKTDTIYPLGVTKIKKAGALTASYYKKNETDLLGINCRENNPGVAILQLGRGFNKGGIIKDKAPTLTTSSWEHNNKLLYPVRIGDLYPNGSQGGRVYSVDGKSVAVAGAGAELCKINLPNGNYAVRKLTPVECERLQTMPDDYTLKGMNETGNEVVISNTQRYKQLGNGWTVDVIVHIFKHLNN